MQRSGANGDRAQAGRRLAATVVNAKSDFFFCSLSEHRAGFDRITGRIQPLDIHIHLHTALLALVAHAHAAAQRMPRFQACKGHGDGNGNILPHTGQIHQRFYPGVKDQAEFTNFYHGFAGNLDHFLGGQHAFTHVDLAAAQVHQAAAGNLGREDHLGMQWGDAAATCRVQNYIPPWVAANVHDWLVQRGDNSPTGAVNYFQAVVQAHRRFPR